MTRSILFALAVCFVNFQALSVQAQAPDQPPKARSDEETPTAEFKQPETFEEGLKHLQGIFGEPDARKQKLFTRLKNEKAGDRRVGIDKESGTYTTLEFASFDCIGPAAHSGDAIKVAWMTYNGGRTYEVKGEERSVILDREALFTSNYLFFKSESLWLMQKTSPVKSLAGYGPSLGSAGLVEFGPNRVIIVTSENPNGTLFAPGNKTLEGVIARKRTFTRKGDKLTVESMSVTFPLKVDERFGRMPIPDLDNPISEVMEYSDVYHLGNNPLAR
jgi:hypothetical protein